MGIPFLRIMFVQFIFSAKFTANVFVFLSLRPLVQNKYSTADTDLLKMVPVEILLNFGNHFSTLQLGF